MGIWGNKREVWTVRGCCGYERSSLFQGLSPMMVVTLAIFAVIPLYSVTCPFSQLFLSSI